jgi:hypothetical protein
MNQIGVPLCIPVRGLQSAAEPSHNGGLDASHEVRVQTFSAGTPHNWCTAGDENLS